MPGRRPINANAYIRSSEQSRARLNTAGGDGSMGFHARTGSIAAVVVFAVLFGVHDSASPQISAGAHRSATSTSLDWPVYGGQAAADHYSTLSQINRQNVRNLQVAWKFDAGEEGGLETSPSSWGTFSMPTPRRKKSLLSTPHPAGSFGSSTPASPARIQCEGFPIGRMAKMAASSPRSPIFCMRLTLKPASRFRHLERAEELICAKICAAITACCRLR
jgi:hypothetical protein